MRFATLILTVAIGHIGLGANAHAQQYPPVPQHWESLHHASTPAEAQLNGLSRVQRSRGEAAYYFALAAEHHQEALRQRFELRQRQLAHYAAKRDQVLEKRAARVEQRRAENERRRQYDAVALIGETLMP